jgi:putative holliday junction resolvase
MRILAVDYGEKRIGLAVTDERSIIAQPMQNVARNGGEFREITSIAGQYGVGRIIVGLPLKRDGSSSESTLRARRFGEMLKKTSGLEVEYWDESFTTKDAEELMISMGATRARRRKSIDSISACLILRAYLEAHGGNI